MPYNFFVVTKTDATSQEKEELYQYLYSQGLIKDYNEIMEHSNAMIDEWIRTAFPLPLFLVAIATINAVCICAVIVKRSMADMSKYYLIGCTQRRGVGAIVLSLAALFVVPGVLNLLSVLCFPNFLREPHTAGIDYILDARCVIPVMLYLAALLVVIAVLPVAMYSRYSPMRFYRKQAVILQFT